MMHTNLFFQSTSVHIEKIIVGVKMRIIYLATACVLYPVSTVIIHGTMDCSVVESFKLWYRMDPFSKHGTFGGNHIWTNGFVFSLNCIV